MPALSPFAESEDLQTVSLDDVLKIREPSVYLVRISGDSMEGAGIFDDDLLVVNRAIEARHGQIVVAAVNGEPACKRLHIRGKEIILQSENPQYPKRYILPGDDFSVWGVVTYSLRSYGPA